MLRVSQSGPYAHHAYVPAVSMRIAGRTPWAGLQYDRPTSMRFVCVTDVYLSVCLPARLPVLSFVSHCLTGMPS